MKFFKYSHSLSCIYCLVLTLLSTSSVYAGPIFFEATGLADVTDKFSKMQNKLGNPLNGNTPGPLNEGRRQINWDAGIVPFDMPRDFFNNTNFPPTRGAVFSNTNNEFRVSNDGIDNRFDTFNHSYANQFTTFSAPRLFSPLDSNIFDIDFFIPATNTPGSVSGFGAVFTDVDLLDTTSIEWFGLHGELLAQKFVKPDAGGLSFLGGVFDDPVAKVRITLGNTPLGLGAFDMHKTDIVVLDDFIYGEPSAVSEPEMFSIFGLGLLGLFHLRRKKSRLHDSV